MVEPPHTPLRATWSSLQCLAALALTPPSPTCSPTARQKRLTSGEIPFFFDAGIDRPTSPVDESICTTQFGALAGFDPDASYGRTPTADPFPRLVVEESASPSRRASVNTFGFARSPSLASDHSVLPLPGPSPDLRYFSPSFIPFSTPNLPSASHYSPTLAPAYIPSPRLSAPTTPEPADEHWALPPIPTPHSPEPRPLPDHRERCESDDVIHITYEVPTAQSDETFATYFTACDKMARSDSVVSGMSFLTLDEPDAAHENDIFDLDDIADISASSFGESLQSDQSLAFAQPSPSFSVSSCFPPPPRAPGGGISRHAAIRRSSQSQRRGKVVFDVPVAPAGGSSPMIFANVNKPHVRARSQSSLSSTETSAHSSESDPVRAPHPVPQSAPPSSLHLPAHLAWLEHIGLELMIDQEHFREIRPAFRLAGMLAGADGHALAEFKPAAPRGYHFHHSTLDPDPVLRRLLVDGDEERDVFARVAVLALKADGVYAVGGAEPAPKGKGKPAPKGKGKPAPKGKGKPAWRLTYAVAPRLSAAGAPLPGERTLTPLSFACAPRLLHADFGARVGLLQLARKAARPRLIAQRVELLRTPAVPARAKENRPPWPDAHSRHTSAASSDGAADDDKRGLLRRRAASTATPPPPPVRIFGHPFASGMTLVEAAPPKPAALDRHILSHAELAHIESVSHKASLSGLAPPPVASRSLNGRLQARANGL